MNTGRIATAIGGYGWLVGVVGMLLMGAILYLGAPQQVGLPAPSEDVKVVPASGIDGFPVEQFCVDPLTKVRELPAPDASGTAYQLVRVRDQRTETVVVVMDTEGGMRLGTHYYDTAVGQDSEPAVLNGDARACIDKKKGK